MSNENDKKPLSNFELTNKDVEYSIPEDKNYSDESPSQKSNQNYQKPLESIQKDAENECTAKPPSNLFSGLKNSHHQPKRNFIFCCNLTTNQPVNLDAYDKFFFSKELINPLHHLSNDIQALCYINFEERKKFVLSVIDDMEKFLGKPIEPIDDPEIERRTAYGEHFDMYLPIGESTLLKSPCIQKLQNNYQTKCKIFRNFHDTYYSSHHKQNLRTCAFNAFEPKYVPRTKTEQECYQKLMHFLKGDGLSGYEIKRTKIEPRTSQLSHYFSLGVMSFEYVIEIVHANVMPNSSWAEFERQCHWILYCKLRALEDIDMNFPAQLTTQDQENFLNWAHGTLPEVNQVDFAINRGMRDLKTGKPISNRFRLMTTHYLVKTLGIDWRYGEFLFRASLRDSHSLVNYYNWRWQCTKNRFFSNYNLKTQLAQHG